MKQNRLRIAVAMSGGVDSSLAAAILKRKGFDVIGLTIRTWPKDECGTSFEGACCNLESITRARMVANKLGIPYYVVDLSSYFKKDVIDYFSREYSSGRTPNPCVICNERMKFGHLLEKSRVLGADHIATGHFAKVSLDSKSKRYLLREGADKSKDQSYFLFTLSQEQLKRAVFPLGSYTKVGVRKLAKRWKLDTFDVPSSQDVCFVQGLSYADYIKKTYGMKMAGGEIVLASSGKVLGRHKGVLHYTIGQRKGLGVAFKELLYVTKIDAANNRIMVGAKKDVMKKSVIVDRVNWISRKRLHKSVNVMVKIRYNHKKAPALISNYGKGAVLVEFTEAQFAPTPGQAAVFYEKHVVLGGGWIREAQ